MNDKADLYFQNTKTGLKYRVVKMDPVKKEITFQTEWGQFTEPYSKERFQKMNYVLVKEEKAA